MSKCRYIAWNVTLLCICAGIAASVKWHSRMDDHALIHGMNTDLSPHRHIRICSGLLEALSPEIIWMAKKLTTHLHPVLRSRICAALHPCSYMPSCVNLGTETTLPLLYNTMCFDKSLTLVLILYHFIHGKLFQAFPMVYLLNTQIRNSFNILQIGVQNMYEGVVSFSRIKVA